jgi:hypothetical protein
MGYISEVGLALTADGKRKLDKALDESAQTDAQKAEPARILLENSVMREDKASGAVAYYWDYLKWYSDFDDVAFFEAFMAALEKNDGYSDYHFIRLGEDDDDTEYRGGFTDNPFGMCIVRCINFDTKAVNEKPEDNVPVAA